MVEIMIYRGLLREQFAITGYRGGYKTWLDEQHGDITYIQRMRGCRFEEEGAMNLVYARHKGTWRMLLIKIRIGRSGRA